MRFRYYMVNRARLGRWITRARNSAKHAGHVLIITSHLFGVPMVAVEVWFFIDPPAPIVPTSPPVLGPQSPYADA
jgi:hypothetical protein